MESITASKEMISHIFGLDLPPAVKAEMIANKLAGYPQRDAAPAMFAIKRHNKTLIVIGGI